MLRKGVAFSELMQVVRQVYVDTSEQQLINTEGKATTSRIAIVTGLTRKDVAQLRKTPFTPESISSKYNRSIRVINGWLEDKEFCTPGGYPEVLLIHGDKRSFQALVERYSGNMTTRSMLDELESVGILKRIEKEHVSLQHHAFIPTGDEEAALTMIGTDVAQLIATIDHNMTHQPEEKRFQRKVSYDNLPDECMQELQEMVNRDAQVLLEKLNAWMVKHDRDSNPDDSGIPNTSAIKSEGRNKAGIGVFYFEEDVQDHK